MSGRPLMALWIVKRNVPAPGFDSFAVVHWTRSDPESLVNDSVWVLPRPDHDPSDRHTTSGSGALPSGAWHAAPNSNSPNTRTASAAVRPAALVECVANNQVVAVWPVPRMARFTRFRIIGIL
jgi:hypothetical protein